MYQFLDNTARYDAIVREADHDHLVRSVRVTGPRKPLLEWVALITARVQRLA